jgi:hypothetical protein
VAEEDPPEEPDESPAEQGPNIMMPSEEFAGKWANAAAIARTPHEFTLDFMRIGPQGQQGMVVSRVSFSPLLASQLLDLLGEQWREYTEESGVPPEGDAVRTHDAAMRRHLQDGRSPGEPSDAA